MTNTDSLRRDDMQHATPPATKVVCRKLWGIMYTTVTGDRKHSRKLYPHATARRLVARLNRRTHADAHASPMMVHVTVPR